MGSIQEPLAATEEGCREVRARPGWAAMARMPAFVASSRRWSSRVNITLASLLWL